MMGLIRIRDVFWAVLSDRYPALLIVLCAAALLIGTTCVVTGPVSNRNLVVAHKEHSTYCWELSSRVETKAAHVTWDEGEGTVVVSAPYSVTAVNGGAGWEHAYNRLGMVGRSDCSVVIFTRFEKENRGDKR